jgi:hypothetical protein
LLAVLSEGSLARKLLAVFWIGTPMNDIKARKVKIDGDKVLVFTLLRRFSFKKADIQNFKVLRVPSLFDEIGIELQANRKFLITERVLGFFDLASFLDLEQAFGPLWYRDAEDGHQLEKCTRMPEFP